MRQTVLIAMFLAGCTTASMPPTPEDAVSLIPDNYGVSYENDFIRAVEHRIQPGTREPVHSHPYPRVVYAINDSRLRVWNGNSQILESKAGDVVFREAQVHAIENIGTEEASFLMVEMMTPEPIGRFVVGDDDGTRLAPETYRLLLENDRVRVIEIRSKPGLTTAMHSHPARAFRYRMMQTQSRITFDDGKTVETDNPPGPVWTGVPLRHVLENIGTTESRTILVEVK